LPTLRKKNLRNDGASGCGWLYYNSKSVVLKPRPAKQFSLERKLDTLII